MAQPDLQELLSLAKDASARASGKQELESLQQLRNSMVELAHGLSAPGQLDAAMAGLDTAQLGRLRDALARLAQFANTETIDLANACNVLEEISSVLVLARPVESVSG